MPRHPPLQTPATDPALPGWIRSRDISAAGRAPHLDPLVPAEDSALLTVEEVASLLRVSPRTVRRLIACGDLRALKIRRSVRVPRQAVEALLAWR